MYTNGLKINAKPYYKTEKKNNYCVDRLYQTKRNENTFENHIHNLYYDEDKNEAPMNYNNYEFFDSTKDSFNMFDVFYNRHFNNNQCRPVSINKKCTKSTCENKHNHNIRLDSKYCPINKVEPIQSLNSMKIDMKQKLKNIQNTKFIISLSYQSLINIEDFKKQIEIERLNQQREFNALKHKVNINKLSIENKKLNRELQLMMSNVNLEIKKTDIQL